MVGEWAHCLESNVPGKNGEKKGRLWLPRPKGGSRGVQVGFFKASVGDEKGAA